MPYTLLQASKLLGYKEESATALPSYDVEKGKQGYEKYLSDYKPTSEQKTANKVLKNSPGSRHRSGLLKWSVKTVAEADEMVKPNDKWTDDQKYEFGYYYLQDKNKAKDYAREVNNQINTAKLGEDKIKIVDFAKKHKGLATVAQIASVYSGPMEYAKKLIQTNVAGGVVVNNKLSPGQMSETMGQTIAQHYDEKYGAINSDIPLIGGLGAGSIYNTVVSRGQSLLAAGTGGSAGTLALYFANAASSAYDDAVARGASKDQALALSVASGLAEGIPEMFSAKKIIGLNSDAKKNLFKKIYSTVLSEGVEEGATSILNQIAENAIMNDLSQFNANVEYYMANGMTEKQAESKAWWDAVTTVFQDSLMGAFSGAMGGAAVGGAGNIANRLDNKSNAAAKETLTPKTTELIEEGKKYKPTEKRAANLEKKIAEGKEASGYELRMLESEISNASRDADVDTLREAIVQKMKAEGLSDTQAKRLGEIALNKAIGNEISAIQETMLKRNDAAMKVYKQMDTDNMLSGYADSEWTKATPLAKLKADSGELQKGIERQLSNAKVEYDQSKIVDKSGKAIFEKSSADSKIHLDGISSDLTKNNVAELKAIEKIANELGVNIHVYETMLDKKGDRVYIDKDGNKITSSGYYDPKDKSIHIDLKAGQGGEGTMLYTASHELVHYMKDISKEHYDALEQLVTDELIKGGKSIEALMEAQRQKALENGQTLTDEEIREEMIADACQSFLASKSAIADIKALKTKNKSLWTALKKFFTTLFTKLNKIYKTVDPDSAEGKYIADMRNSVKNIRDAFMEGVTSASETKAQKEEAFKKSYIKSKDIRNNARYVKTHKEALENLDYKASAVSKEEILKGYDKLLEIWDSLGGEINSEFLKDWNDKSGKDRAFTVFKEQAGYKYNVELSSMCKKGIPLFEAIDYIVREEISNQLKTKTIGKAEKEILYDLLKKKGFEIPCAICYVEQARVREGEIIDSFLEGKREYNKQGVETTHKIGWNETFADLEKGMRARGVKYTFPEVSRSISTDAYSKMEVPPMDEKTQKAFYDTLLKLVNKEVERYNATKSKKAKERMPLKSITPSEIKRCLSGTLSSNLKLYKTIAMNPDSRFTIKSDLLYSSATTTNLAIAHNALYSLFNQQGGVSGYKSKQGTVVYWGDILNKKWDASKLRKEGGVRNQSNSDFMMYTLLDHAQMYMDFTAKGYYLQAYTKVLAELKLFGLSRGKINASLIPKVVVYYNTDGSVDIERTRENAGLDEKGNPIYDDIEGVNHKEAFMLLEDSEYSKSIGGICIGYSDNHIRKLLDDKRVQQIIGFHDKTDDPAKRYPGARYAKNYNGENEAVTSDGETKHIGFNQFVISAEKLFTKDKNGTFSGEADFNGKHYTADDIPKLAADMYLKMCADKGYTEAYKQFSDHPNYYKLLADFSLYDSEGHYAPHQKVAYNMPDTVPYLDENGKKQYLDTKRYIKRELVKELFVRDDISSALSDHSEEGLIPQFIKKVNILHNKDIALTEKYNESIDELWNGTFESKENTHLKVLAETPKIYLDKADASNREIIMAWDIAYLAMHKNGEIPGNYHGLGKDIMKALPNAIKNPLYIIKQKNGRIAAVTEIVVKGKKAVFASIELEAYKTVIQNGESSKGTYNLIVTVMDAQPNYLKNTVFSGDVVYNKNKEDPTHFILRLKLLNKAMPTYDHVESSNDRIPQPPEKINTSDENSSEIPKIRSQARDTAGNTLTSAQQEYFKDSVVRDSKGNLMVLYHGTTADFNEFKKGDVGFHFGTKGAARGRVGYGKNVTLKEVYLNITNPIVFDDDLGSWDADYRLTRELYDRGILTQAEAETVLLTDSKQYKRTTEAANKKLAEVLLSKGYDGIEYTNTHESKKNSTSYIVFESNQAKLITNTNPTASKDIRYQARRSSTPAPYISPTAKSIVTNIESGYKYTKMDKLKTSAIATQIAFTNAQAGIESIAKKYGVKDIEALVQAARVATNQAEEMIGGNQYRIGSSTKDYLGEGLQKIIQPIQELGKEQESAFYDYLFHQHNADRMSLERRSIEWNEEKKNTLQETVNKFVGVEKEQKALTEEKANLSRKKSDSERRGEINLRLTEIKRELVALGKQIKKLQKELNEFTALKNKPVIGLNREEIEAQKAELSARIQELRDEKKSLGLKKSNEARVKEITKEIADLVKERSELTAEVTEEKSREIISEYEKNYPEFVEIAEKVWNYNKNLNQYRADTGLIDQAQFEYLNKLYPHYVPTYRSDAKTGIAAVKGKNNVAISQSIRTATGSTKDLLNPIVIMARQTMETVRAGRINQIAKALYDGANTAKDKTYLNEVSREKVDRTKLVDIDPTELRPKSNQVTFFKDGERITLQVSSEIFAGFDAFTPQFNVQNPLVKGATALNNTFKKLVTSANPVFLIRNTIRDLQDAGINTKYAKTFMINYARAVNEIRKGGKLWELYRAMGGGNVSYFDFDKGFKAEQTKAGFGANISNPNSNKVKQLATVAYANTLQHIENANAFVECLPRFAEFISSLEAGNSAEQAMLDAADVTTNFARTGKITKALNSTVIPFLNPAIQGASKAIRNVTSIRSVKEAAILAAKAVLVGILPFALNSILYDDDEEYQDLRETDKENNYLFKIGDKFIKIPRGRVAAVLAGAFNRTVKSFDKDEDADWLGYVKNVSTQMNPIENMARTIFSPFMDVANNVTWYGSAIEGREFENKSPAQRYDENTSSIAIALGEVLNYSPKKIHYLLDQYSGVIGDFVLPATTKKAEKDFISGNFTIDPVTSNKLSDQFYDIYYEAQYAKNANANDKTAEYQVKHLNRVKSAISELYDEISKIQNSNKSDSEKLAETRAIRILINETYKTALNDYELITNAIEATSHVKDEYRYAEVQRLVYGAETALKTYDQKVYEKSTTLRNAGISYDNFYKYYFGIKDIKSDKDKNGNTISGSKKEKVIKKINSLNLSDEKKLLLIVYSGYALDSEADKQKLLKYLNNLKVNTSSKQKLAEICGFDYKNGKIVFK